MKTTLCLSLLFGLSLSLTAQSSYNFLTEISYQQAQLDSSENAIYNHFLNSNETSNLKIVTVGDIATIQQNGVLNFTIPQETSIYQAEANLVNYQSPNDYAWNGVMDSLGSITIMKKPQGAIGHINLAGQAKDQYFPYLS